MPETALDTAKDLELARGAAGGSKKSWDSLVDSYAPLVRGTVADYLGSLVEKPSEKEIGALALDFFKSLSADKFEKLEKYRGESSLGSYLAVLAAFFVHDYVKIEHEKTRFANICTDAGGTLWCRVAKEAAVADRGIEDVLEQALASLHPLEALVVRLFYFHALEYEEISALLHMNMGSVTKTVQTARANLAERLAARGRRIEEFLY